MVGNRRYEFQKSKKNNLNWLTIYYQVYVILYSDILSRPSQHHHNSGILIHDKRPGDVEIVDKPLVNPSMNPLMNARIKITSTPPQRSKNGVNIINKTINIIFSKVFIVLPTSTGILIS